MRKISFIIGIVAVMAIGILTGLDQHSATRVEAAKAATTITKNRSNEKSLIIYFSQSGTTKTAAEKIKSATGADMIRLQPKKAYPADYDDYAKVAQRQLKRKIHPAIKTKIKHLDQYDTIYIGFPTWWHQPPMIIHSLFDKFDFSGKTIVPFTTSMSDPVSKSMPTMRRLAKADNAKITAGFRYDDNDKALTKFLSKNNLN